MVPPPGLGALCKQHTLHISIAHIAQNGQQGHFSVGPQRGRGSSPPVSDDLGGEDADVEVLGWWVYT